MPDIGAPELIIILVAVLIIFGPGKLPDLGRTLGKSIREFRHSVQDVTDDSDDSATVAAAAPAPASAPAPAPTVNPNDPPVA